MSWQNEQDDVVAYGPVLPKKGVKLEVAAAVGATWTVKAEGEGGAPGHEGEAYPAMKLTLTLKDDSVQTEGEHIRPRTTIEHQLNLGRYPYLSKKDGSVQWMGRSGLYGLEESLGFEPIFVDAAGAVVPPHITKAGRKVAPKGENIKRQVNPDFMKTYFHADGTPNLEWAGKTVHADLEIERSEKFGDRNVVSRFVAASNGL